MAAFLEVLTRSHRRPNLLRHNIASLQAQIDPDYWQMILYDAQGRGVPWAGAQLAEYSPQCPYVWILDDDDICIHPPLIAELKQITAQHDPDVIMLKMDHGPRGILPDGDYWGRTPAIAHVGCSAYVVHRAIWLVHQEAWRQGGYSADYSFIGSVFSREPRAYWHDVIASRVQQIGLGMPE